LLSTPDSYGYTWVDNDGGGSPVYNWIDITGIGVQVDGLADDNAVGPFDIGFDFPFYWYTVDHFFIGSNGYISFSSDANYSQDFPMIPSTIAPNDLVVPLACDIDFTAPYGTNECYYYTNDTDTLIVSWIGVLEWNSPYNPSATHTFQLILTAADSAITYQYGEQGGDFQNPDGASQIGIEDLVGRTGLRYMYNLSPPNNTPHDGLVIRIHADPDPNFIFHDVGIAGGMNESSGGVFQAQNEPMQLRALVQNFGTADEENITVNCRVKRQYYQIYDEDIIVDQLGAGEEIWVDFPLTVTPEELDVFSLIFKTTLSGDQFFFNNSDTTEMRTYAFPMPLGYADTAYVFTSWQGGGGGFANEFVAPECIEVTGFQAFLQLDGTAACTLLVLPADADGNPDMDNILWSEVIQMNYEGWVEETFDDPLIFYEGEKFFAAALSGGPGVYFGMEENTGTYAPSRDRSVQDIVIRVVCDSHTGIGDDLTSLPVSFSLNQNYPNPFNANTEISFDLESSGNVSLEIYNIAGQKITTLVNGVHKAGSHNVTWNGTSDLKVNDNSQTKKMVLLK